MAALGGISTLQSVVFQIYCIISIMRCHIFWNTKIKLN
jgi:hypothetical protein